MVDALLQVVFDNINSLLQKEFASIWGVDREIKKLSDKLDTIRAVLEDAEMRQFKDKAIKCWLKKLKAAAYDADDILDECAARALQLEGTQMSNCTNQVSLPSSSCFNFEQLIFRRKIGKRIKDVRECIDEIADEGSKFNLNPRAIMGEWTVGTSDRETSSILTDSRVYGRSEDQEHIINALLDNMSNQNLLVYPIIGMGGLGKTTLAQLVYNHERVKNHFETRIWVCISDDFNVQRLTKAIIEHVSGAACDLTKLDSMQNRLREMLCGKRYLIVLDDVWNENQDKWDMVKSSLTCGNEGSAILVTTRLEKVASIMGTFLPRHLKPLSENDCWSLFKQRAFGVGDAREKNTKLEAIGKEIVKKCGGVPLAAKALGSLMRFKHTEDEWMFVRENEIWDLPEDEENTILPALRLSYYHLPSHLRQCFAFCSIFPKDHRIAKEQLVNLWMANGFIPSRGNMELEDIGNEIFNELLWRSFFQNEEKDVHGNIWGYYKMHDLVHDLAYSVMDNECLTFDQASKKNIVPKRIRHLRLNLLHDYSSETSLTSINESLSQSQAIRTLLIDSSKGQDSLDSHHFNFLNYKSLRALELFFRTKSHQPSSAAYMIKLTYLIHLRHLKLYCMSIETLPESLSNLKHLQTLKLKVCQCLHKLPTSMCTMSSLRHLDIQFCDSLKQMPIGIGRLIHLHTLSIFIVGKKSGCHISELQELNNLRGSLHIKDLEKVKNFENAKAANLVRKRKINSLTFSWSPNIDQAQQDASEGVLERLNPPESINTLEIEHYLGTKFPSWMEDLSLLQNLVRVTLGNCNRCEHLPPFGNLPCLKFLDLSGMDSVQHLGAEIYDNDGSVKGFPLLEELYLCDMVNLEGLRLNVPEGKGVLPCLVKMIIIRCHKLTTLPLLPSLHSLFLTLENIPDGLLQIRNLPILQELRLDHCSNLVTLPKFSVTPGELHFGFLERLHVNWCDAMESLWDDETQFQGLSSLKILVIGGCDILTSVSGMRYLTALEELRIDGCPKLEISQLEDFQHLTSLRRMEFVNMNHSISWLENLKHVTTIEYLRISCCEGLSALSNWIHNLTSLRTIDIFACRNLTFLPDGLEQLTALQTLTIRECNNVIETRCREGGEDWYKISHIPNVIVRSVPPLPPYTRQKLRCWDRLLLGLRRRR